MLHGCDVLVDEHFVGIAEKSPPPASCTYTVGDLTEGVVAIEITLSNS